MAKLRTAASRPNTPMPAPTAVVPAIVLPARALNLFALVIAIGCVVVAWLSRFAINPDGVSYLDLARAAADGDFAHFVQGYWSPLYPFILGIVERLIDPAPDTMIVTAHVANLAAVVWSIWTIWRWSRAIASPLFGWLAVAALALSSAGMPRIESVTPDLLLLGLLTAVAHEILQRGTQRWIRIGVLLGAVFLTKTSSWPLLLIAVPLLLWADNTAARMATVRALGVMLAVMLLWIVPLSVKSGGPTLGSAGSLNYSWYIDANTSRLPDGDHGDNTAYQRVTTADSQAVVVAHFDEVARWTYQPWGDPTAWHAKVLSETGHAPSAGELIGYWARLFGRTFLLWSLPLLLLVVAPAIALQYRRDMLRELRAEARNALVIIVLGVCGLLQFAAVHSEPRLIGPYGLLLALGILGWCFRTPIRARSARWIMLAAAAPAIAALAFAIPKLQQGVSEYSHLAQARSDLVALRQRGESSGPNPDRVVVIGPAAPVLGAAYMTGSHIVAQIAPHWAEVLQHMQPGPRAQLLTSLFARQANMLWLTDADGGMQQFYFGTSGR